MTIAKRFGILAALVLLAAAEASAVELSLRAGAAYFRPADAVFRDVYGGGTSFGAELAVALGRRWEAWMGGSVFGKTGRLTFTGEDTEIHLTPVFFGLRFSFARSRLRPYAGLGAGYVFYKETSLLGTTKDQNLGFAVQAGFVVDVTARLFLNVRFAYSTCKVKPEDLEADLGGFEAGLGLGVRFGRLIDR